MAIPEKISFTKGEKTAMIISALLEVSYLAATITLLALNRLDGGAVIMLVVSVIEYVTFGLCAAFPQWTNIMYKPENATPKKCHAIRRGCIAAIIAISAAIAVLTFLPAN